MTHHPSTPKHQSSDKHGSGAGGAGDHQQDATIYQPVQKTVAVPQETDRVEDPASDESGRDDRAVENEVRNRWIKFHAVVLDHAVAQHPRKFPRRQQTKVW